MMFGQNPVKSCDCAKFFGMESMLSNLIYIDPDNGNWAADLKGKITKRHIFIETSFFDEAPK